jgi:hypothetical protein
MMAEQDEDETPELGIPLETVATIADLLNALEDDDLDEDEDLDEEDEDDAEDEDVNEELVEELVNELSEPEQAALVALALVGRGDHEPEEWAEAVKAASLRNAKSDPAQYLLGLEGAGYLLGEGLAAFGISLDEIER